MRVVLLVVLVVLGCAPSAGAVNVPTMARSAKDARLFPDLLIAARYWSAVPDCPNGLRVWRARLVGFEGWASDCTIWIGEARLARAWGSARALREIDAGLCVLVVHEYGHLLGYQHVDDPHAVMYHGRLDPRAVPECAAMLTAPRMTPRYLGAKKRGVIRA